MLWPNGISFEELAEQSKQPDADPFDLLCHLAFNAPLRTRRERAERSGGNARISSRNSATRHARCWTNYWRSMRSTAMPRFVLPDVLHVPPISEHGNPGEIIRLFGSPDKLATAVNDLQEILYGS